MTQILKIKMSRKKPEPGDVFVVQPREGLYFYGKVIQEVALEIDIGSRCMLVFLYRTCSEQMELPDELDPDNLLIPPFIVTGYPWSSGYFYTVGNLGVTQKDDSLDYGFFNALKVEKRYKDAKGNPLSHVPKIRVPYGIYTLYHVETGIEKYMQEAGLGGFRIPTELVRIELSSKRPREGDVFVFQPHEGVYYYGRVMRTKLESKSSTIKGKNLVYLYNLHSHTQEMPDRQALSPDNLLIAPHVVTASPWLNGYFKTIGNYPVQEQEFSKDTGFRVHRTGDLVDVEGNPLDFEPRMTAPFTTQEYWVIGKVVHRRLLEMEGEA
ncbi:immunity 26/phosphotriesterase HocA family protein [Tumebacillus sp. DT12]|uniref:Immunity 26/phosphotriesterase HocA family protein n=1 Tax=Tumebacillus lacus TaxID=2995335 RepID=A0ABT3X437_9BACL|nr:immunity 26/phosphotriesterase HocA family protein [Tumebacillus lacus]MCX7569509.1 immunity 26/phosphotriesterase HocA family protein [Tumebacillus lacus]